MRDEEVVRAVGAALGSPWGREGRSALDAGAWESLESGSVKAAARRRLESPLTVT